MSEPSKSSEPEPKADPAAATGSAATAGAAVAAGAAATTGATGATGPPPPTPAPPRAGSPPPASKAAGATPAKGGAPPAGTKSGTLPPSTKTGLQPAGEMTRRGFFSWLSVAWLAFTGASAIGMAQMGRFMFPGIVVEPPLSFKAGFQQDYGPGVDERWKDRYSIWIVRDLDMGEMYALIAICTHLGCPPNWLPAEEKFKCPCHGSGYYMNGVNFEGPTPRPLERAAISIGEDGQIVVDKGRVFQSEKGQWSDPASFLKI